MDRLGHQGPVEGIAVVQRECRKHQDVGRQDGEKFEPEHAQ